MQRTPLGTTTNAQPRAQEQLSSPLHQTPQKDGDGPCITRSELESSSHSPTKPCKSTPADVALQRGYAAVALDRRADEGYKHQALDGSLLPSGDEVRADSGRLLLQMGRRRIKLLTSGIVVKYGPKAYLTPDAGRAMQLVREHGIVEAPKFLGYYVEGDSSFLFMSYIEGTPLDGRLWRSLSLGQRAAIRDSLKEIIDKMRSIPVPPSTRIGGIGQQAAPLAWPSCDHHPVPSFENEVDMYRWLADDLVQWNVNKRLAARLRSASTRATTLVFTHGDLAGRNIIIKDGKLVGVIDWDWSGWYPDYFERARCELEVQWRSSGLSDMILSLMDTFEDGLTSLHTDFCNAAD